MYLHRGHWENIRSQGYFGVEPLVENLSRIWEQPEYHTAISDEFAAESSDGGDVIRETFPRCILGSTHLALSLLAEK